MCHQCVQGPAFIGLHALAEQQLLGAERVTGGLLFFDDGQGGVGRVVLVRLTLCQPSGDYRLWRIAVKDQEWRAGGLGDLGRRVALFSLEEGRVQYHRETGAQYVSAISFRRA